MTSLPLHPAIVHLPLGLALLMPLMAIGFAWAIWTGRVRTRAWIAVVALQALLLASALVAINTGGAEEERVEAVVQEAPLHQHEEFAEQFAWASGATLALSFLVVVFKRPSTARMLSGAVVAATVVVAALGLRVGHAGGQLVYTHGAAGAYVPASGTSSVPTEPGAAARRDSDQDDDDRRGGKGVR